MTQPTDTQPPTGGIPLITDLDKILQRFDDASRPSAIVLLDGVPEAADLNKIANRIDATVLLAAKGLQVLDTSRLAERLRTQPKRRTGTHVAHTLLAFTLLVNRFKAGNSAIFANRDGANLTAILDFHPEGADNAAARFGEHRVEYNLPHSEEWNAWLKFDAQPMDQGMFAAFIEERLADVAMPDPQLLGTISEAATGGDFGTRTPAEELAYLAKTLQGTFATPSELVTLSRGLHVREELTVKSRENLSNGETTITFDSQHQDGSGAALRVPNLFLIAIPVYDLGERYLIAVRLRYRISGGKVKWFYQLYRLGRILDHAFTEAALRATADTQVPMFRGTDK